MDLVYISCISGMKSAGLTYSIPSQIESQSLVDGVVWYNLNPEYRSTASIECINGKDIKAILPLLLHSKPDLVIFEGFYFRAFCRLATALRKHRVPYVIVPRGSLTQGAQYIKQIKKKIGNWLCFHQFAKQALAIQYLTSEECIASGEHWNKKSIVVPNGMAAKSRTKEYQSNCGFHGAFIGRLDVFHKGIDLLIAACAMVKDEMELCHCQIKLYGDDQQGSMTVIQGLIATHGLQHLLSVQEAIYDDAKEVVLLECEFFILTSRFEGHPMALIEALSYGLPCVVTSGTNMAEEVDRFDAGWTAESTSRSIANALLCVMKEQDKFASKGKNALALSKKYDWALLAQKNHENYLDLLTGNQ